MKIYHKNRHSCRHRTTLFFDDAYSIHKCAFNVHQARFILPAKCSPKANILASQMEKQHVPFIVSQKKKRLCIRIRRKNELGFKLWIFLYILDVTIPDILLLFLVTPSTICWQLNKRKNSFKIIKKEMSGSSNDHRRSNL